ncbi:NAD(P)-dependent oxidoreductase [Trinickia diaoshuihuensis]|jgi:3-hydroxyisobutyrate dehydrogenase|uniref:NAD(P)-dependent oxidoreductase n=1 Tax=Trinickia diaoshuihuensis TaxID=2292265 RepID=UPI000E27EB05|nr:NAD(P)-dependent oxidoreductase [Trinickia diaoshuihuensis]
MESAVCSPPVREAALSPSATFHIGLIGTGKMGLPIAKHLQRGGYRVTVFDTSKERLALARTHGLQAGDTLDQAVESAQVIISSLPNDGAFEAVASDVATRVRPGQVYVDMSTVSLAASQQVARAYDEAQADYLRVAVSGNPQMVENAQLTAIASGPRRAFDRVLPLLELLGPAQFYVGARDEARTMKLVINLMVANTAAMLAEALALGQKAGLRWSDMWEVIPASAVGSPVIKAKAEQLKRYDFTPTFTVNQMLKDVGLVLEAGAALHVPLAHTAGTAQQLQQASALGFEGDDYAAIIKAVQQSAGLPQQA